jgi:hypothetical protein
MTDYLTDERILEILGRYHDIARGNGALELVAKEITAGEGSREEILWEVVDVAAELGYSIAPEDRARLRFALTNYGARLAAELEAEKLSPGDKVRIVAPDGTKLGAMLHEEETRFVGWVPGATEGTYRGQHPNERLTGWALVDVAADAVELDGCTLADLDDPETLVVPVLKANLERVE